jgi:hypothetical protein
VIEDDLTALGFEQRDGGTLVAPPDSCTALIPIGRNYYRLWIELEDGTAVVCVVAKCALKIMPETEPAVRIDTDDAEED